MSATATQFTLADLERMPDDGMHREILDGELIELPPPKSGHSLIASQLVESLIMYLKKGQALKVLVEAGYKLSEDEKHWLQPDVSIMSTARARQTAEDEYFLGAPEAAFEIISPSESATDVLDKTEAYMEAGSKVVVNVYPKSRTVTIHLPDGSARTLKGKDSLCLPELLPGWEISLSEIFG